MGVNPNIILAKIQELSWWKPLIETQVLTRSHQDNCTDSTSLMLGFTTYHLSFMIAEWIRRVPKRERQCQICESNSARFVSEIYGYEGFEADEERREALRENETVTRETFVVDAALTIHKIYEAQSRGIYRVMNNISLCGLCVADIADCHLGMDHAGALTVTRMVSSLGIISCLVGWHLPSMNDVQRVPLLLYTKARTIYDVLPVVRSPLVLLDEKEGN